ncbi:unnamed protein product [Pneumocystis jirovecii]|uniref:NTF2 domain-containing protein n=1 Tax=Pneumocystis jirovecii TaxID=42068 RepID=L0PAM9_PNEJI|nr:unnamed protein product [Pneumocystis jirovecii]
MEKLSLDEVGWFFVQEYYTFLNREPGRLHCFYTKRSTLIHGNEGENVNPCSGQQEIHKKIIELGFSDCKVLVSNVDSQASTNGGIVIQVLGEMSNCDGPSRRFAQTFFLAEQPNGYFVLNDIFRYLKEDMEDGELCNGECHSHTADLKDGGLSSCIEINDNTQFVSEQKYITTTTSILSCDNNANTQSTRLNTITDSLQDSTSIPPTSVANTHHEVDYEKLPLASSLEKISLTEHIPDSTENIGFDNPQLCPTIFQPSVSVSSAPKTWANLFDKTSPQLNKTVSSVVKPTAIHVQAPLVSERTLMSSTSVFVKNIKDGISEADLKHVFSKFGSIHHIDIKKEKSCALVYFETSSSAISAIAAGSVKIAQDTLLIEERKNNRDRNRNSNGERRVGGREYTKYGDEKRTNTDKRGYMNKNRAYDKK